MQPYVTIALKWREAKRMIKKMTGARWQKLKIEQKEKTMRLRNVVEVGEADMKKSPVRNATNMCLQQATSSEQNNYDG